MTAEDTIYTYAFALKKVNEKGETLEGATFQLPFFVKKTTDTDGAYVYAGTTDGTDLTKTVTTPKNGLIIVTMYMKDFHHMKVRLRLTLADE